MGAGNLRTKWRRYLYTTKVVAPQVVVFCLALADDMDARGYVEVERPELAERMRLSERAISKRLKAACDARILDRYRTGGNGRKAAYIALVPNEVAGTHGGAQLPRVVGTAAAHYFGEFVPATLSDNRGVDGRATRARTHAHHRNDTPLTHRDSITGSAKRDRIVGIYGEGLIPDRSAPDLEALVARCSSKAKDAGERNRLHLVGGAA